MADNRIIDALKMTAPGTTLRLALESIVRAKTGALILIADLMDVKTIIEGGFELNINFSPEMLYELAKMDGGILVSSDCTKIMYANIHFVPNANFRSNESGIRHRTAEQVAKQTGALVIAISQRRNIISLYQARWKYVLHDIGFLLTKANQAVQALDRYKTLFEQALVKLSALEFGDHVTLYDVGAVLRRAKMINHLLQEVERYIVELGHEGHLIFMQSQEISILISKQTKLIIRDYLKEADESAIEVVYTFLCQLNEDALFAQNRLYQLMGYPEAQNISELQLKPGGFRLLDQIPRIPTNIIDNLVRYFGSLNAIMEASLESLDEVEGIGEVRAKTIKQGLNKLKQQVVMDIHY